jgi:hypothetical protein
LFMWGWGEGNEGLLWMVDMTQAKKKK